MNVLTKKFGPLPLWGWAAVALVGLYLWRRQQSAASASQQAASSSQGTPSTYPTDVGAPAYYGYGGSGGGTPPAGTYSYQPPGTSSTGTTGGATSPPPGVPTTSPTPGSGGGVAAGYSGITNPDLAAADIRAGVPLYYNTAGAGQTPVYERVTAQSNLPKGTGLYVKNS